MGRFSYLLQAGHLSSSFGEWWQVRESPHNASNDDKRVQPGVSKRISPPCSVLIQSMMGRFSFSSQSGPSCRCSVHGGEILLLATTRQTTMRDVQPGASKTISPPCSLIIIRSDVGRFPYSPQAGYLMSSFGAGWPEVPLGAERR